MPYQFNNSKVRCIPNEFEKDCRKTVIQSNLLSQQLEYPSKKDVLTSTERKLILYLIAQVKPYDSNFVPCKISMNYLARILNVTITGGSAWDHYIKMLINLSDKYFSILNRRLHRLRWIKPVGFDPHNRTVTLCLHEDMRLFIMIPYHSEKTIFAYGNVMNLRRKHSVTLYLLLRSAKQIKQWNEPMRHFAGLIGYAYSRFSDIEERVLIPCLEEINRETDIFVKYQVEIRKRKVVTIKFEIQHNIREILEQRKKEKMEVNAELEAMDQMLLQGNKER